ncbi:MCM DNA helicase complex subunit [Phlyctochytrium bullatum]|nr:MCM DNA helicase complex subunit [Phlyctochytrium bullatum]
MDADPLRNVNAEEQFNERVRFFQDFLDRDFGENEYKDKIRRMISAYSRRLIVSIDAIRSYSPEYAEGICKTPIDYVPAFDKAVKDTVLATDIFTNARPMYTKNGVVGIEDVPFWVGFEGSFGDQFLSPRKLSAKHLGKMVCLEGIVTKCSLVRPKLMKSMHFCEKTEVFHSREYRDGLSLSHAIPTVSAFPKQDDDGNPLSPEYGFCVYRDFQTLTLQEMPERSPAGQLPRPIDIILEDDLVDAAKPGDRVQIVGVYRTRGGKGRAATAMFTTVVLANQIRHLAKEMRELELSDVDIRNVKRIAKRKDLFDLLGHSLAPSIFGHHLIKKAILLLLVGGLEKNLENGTHLRGDINMLMIGDPSTAKSQLLRFVLNTAPLAIATTGRGSSGVGLTAAVTQDKETGERTLEAGAMVLADRGVVCIDEFDKMSDIDRVAIHEVMEQQTVTIAKAGIHTSLNARCSVIAAANPAFGRYDNQKSPHQNIALPDSLLSRFDLIFVVLDNLGPEHNRSIADHIIRLHQYVPPGLEEGRPVNDNTIAGLYSLNSDQTDDVHRDDVFLKYNKLLHVGIPATGRGSRAKVEILSMNFIKKFVHYVKNRIKPVLSDEAKVAIGETYGRLRMQEDGVEEKFRTMPITPRTLETLIRLSTAHAKLRLSSRVEKVDTDAATAILEFALYQKMEKKKRNKRQKVAGDQEEGSASDDETDSDSDGGGGGKEGGARASRRPPPTQSSPTSRGSRTPRAAAKERSIARGMEQLTISGSVETRSEAGGVGDDSSLFVPDSQSSGLGDFPTDSVSQISSRRDLVATQPTAMVQSFQLNDERYTLFKERCLPPLNTEWRTNYVQMVAVADILTAMNGNLPMSMHFTAEELVAALKRLTGEETSFMLDEEMMQLILV